MLCGLSDMDLILAFLNDDLGSTAMPIEKKIT
jgi:hypothetical protein